MELTLDALGDTRQAFDRVAPHYDRSNSANPIICAMRQRTLSEVTSRMPPGAALLDLGCGPGADAASLAQLGYRITAVDWSPAMAREARHRVAQDGLGALVDVRALGIQELDRLQPALFDGAYSDLGPLNCVPDLAAAARAIAARLRPGGLLVASVIGRVCPWEIARYGLAGRWRRARVRFAAGFVPVPLEGRTVWTRYYAPAEFESAFLAAGFRRLSLAAMSLLVPPPYMEGFHGRHPALMTWLERLDDRVGAWPGLRNWGDHFLIVMRKV